MITEQETRKYEVNTFKTIESSFTGAYDSITDAPIVNPPQKSVTVSGVISMVLVAGMCVLTFFSSSWKQWGWGVAAGLSLAAIVLIIRRYLKALKKFQEANSAGSKRFDYKEEYMSLFPELPGRMNASELIKAVSPMQNKQSRDVYNNAIRDLITSLNTVNNPQDILCRNLTTYGDLFSQLRKRCYIGENGSNDIVIYDSDCLAPRGELVVEPSDILSYGVPDTFGDKLAGVRKAGVKISSDAVIVAIKTDEEGGVLYLETHASDFEKLKKLLGRGKLN